MVGQRFGLEPFNNLVLNRPGGEEVACWIMVADVVSLEVRVDIHLEVLIVGAEEVAHIDDGVGLVLEPINKALVESWLAAQICSDIALAERENYH